MNDARSGGLGVIKIRQGCRYFMRYVFTIIFTLSIFGCSIYSPTDLDKPPVSHEYGLTKDQVDGQFESIASHLKCDRSFYFYDDIHSFPYMRGVTCITQEDPPVNVRVFTSSASMIQNLDSAIGLSREDQVVLLGENWLAIASIPVINMLRLVDSDTSVLSRAETLSFLEQNGQVQPYGAAATFCVGWASTLIAEMLSGDVRSELDKHAAENMYPGILNIIEKLLESNPNLSLVNDDEFIEFKVELSKHINVVKEFCAHSVGIKIPTAHQFSTTPLLA